MNVDSKLIESEQKLEGWGNRVLEVMELQLDNVNLSTTNGTFKAATENVGVEIREVTPQKLQDGLTFAFIDSDNSGIITDDKIGVVHHELSVTENIQSSISLQLQPADNVTSPEKELRVAFTIFSEPTLFIPRDYQRTDTSTSNAESIRRPNTHVLSATIYGIRNDSVNIRISSIFEALETTNKTTRITDPSCVFWDFLGDNGFGNWSTDGCKLTNSDISKPECECNHVTNFAVLMNFHKTDETQFSSVLSYVGCGLSALCLLITLVLYGITPEIRRKQPNQIFMCLCGSLLCLYIAYMINTSLDRRQFSTNLQVDRGVCGFLAAIVQYFTLSSLCWMGVEGFNMYLLFVNVMKSYVESFMVKACLFAWGVPALIVLITGSVARKNYASKDVCFLDRWATVGGVLIPVALIMIGNVVVFVLVILRLRRRVPGKIQERQTHQERVKRVQNAVCILLLLGLTWVFGYLLLIKASNNAFQIIFIIFNSFQGFLIFVFYCLRQPTLRKRYCPACQAREAKQKDVVTESHTISMVNSKPTD